VESNFCYNFQSTPRSWNVAQNLCGDLGGKLTEITEIADQTLVGDLCMNERCWLGGDQAGWINLGPSEDYSLNNFGADANIGTAE
jgi:hypothetical protein